MAEFNIPLPAPTARGKYNVVPPVLSDGQTVELQVDVNGLLKTNTEVTANISGAQEVIISAVDDSIRIGNGLGDFLAINPDGSINTTTTATLPAGAATAAKQDTGNASLASIDSKLTSPLAVTGPLTDAQLRASPVPVSGTISLPTGAATSANQSTEIASLASIDDKSTQYFVQTFGPINPTPGAPPVATELFSVDTAGYAVVNLQIRQNEISGTGATQAILVIEGRNSTSDPWTSTPGAAIVGFSASSPMYLTYNGDIIDNGLLTIPAFARYIRGIITDYDNTNGDNEYFADVYVNKQFTGYQPVVLGNLGQHSVADSQSVVLAFDQDPIPVTQSGTWVLGANSGVDIGDVTVNNAAGAAAVNIQDGGNSITVDGSVSATVSGTVAATQSGAWSTGRTWTLASGTDSVAAVQSGTWNITNISGTISLPTGAATAALQTQPGVDIGDVTVNNAGGAAAVNIQDGGNSITVDNTTLSVVGGGTEATALRVTIANDSTGVLSVDDNGGSLTVDGTVTVSNFPTTLDTNYGTVGASTLRGAAQIGNATGAADFNAGATGAQTLRVTANAGTNLNTSLLALEAGGNLATIKTNTDNLALAQASATSGQKGNLVLTATTTGAPTYTTATSNPLSTTTAGALRVDGSAVTQPVSGTFFQGTQPVSLAAGAASIGKAEDTASVTADVGVGALAIRKATPANLSDTDGDYEFLQMSAGRLWTSATIDNAPTLTKGTQGAQGFSVQALNDAGRNQTNFFMAIQIVTTATDALLSLTGYKSGAAVGATTTPAVVTSGKTYRITSVTMSYTTIVTTPGSVRFTLRANTGGVVAIGSPAVCNWEVGEPTGIAPVAGKKNTVHLSFPDGIEFAAGTGIGISQVGLNTVGGAAVVGYGQITIHGYEY